MSTPAPVGVDARVGLYRHTRTFYVLSIAIPWALWLVAAWTSRIEPQTYPLQLLTTALGLAGLAAPCLVAYALVHRDPRLVDDVRRRLTLRGLRPALGVLAVLLMPVSLLAAIALSLPFGGGVSQFALKGSHVAIALLPGWLTVTLAPLLEELAWHGYGIDALTRRWSLWRATWVFSIFWALWHVPLQLIKGSYQAEVAQISAAANLNFFVSILPFMVIMNWLYYRCGRSVWVAVAFHLAANVGNEIISANPDTKIIQTVLLVPLCAFILVRDRRLFFGRQRQG